MAKGLMLVFSNPVRGKEVAFNQWYDNQHVGDVLDVPGVIAGQRYEWAPVKVPEGDDVPAQAQEPPPHRYLAVYELDRDPAEVMNDMVARAGTSTMPLGDTLDMSTVSFTFWQPRGEPRIAER